MSSKPILIMVSTIVNDANEILKMVLYNYRDNNCIVIEYSEIVEMMKEGICIGNIKLSKRFKLETFPRACGFNRYYSYTSSGHLVNCGISKILISEHKDSIGTKYTFFDIKHNQCEVADKNLMQGNSDISALFANILDEESAEEKLMFSSYFKYKCYNIMLKTNVIAKDIKYEIDIYGNLINYESTNDVDIIGNCVWIIKVGSIKSKKIIVDGTVYGIGYKVFSKIDCKEIRIGYGVKEIEAQSIVMCNKLDIIKFPKSLKDLKSYTIVNCAVKTIELYGDTLIKDSFISNCKELTEIIIHGKSIQFQKDIRRLVDGCNSLKYVVLDKEIDDESINTIYNICNKNVAIIME